MSSRWILFGYKVFNEIFEIVPSEAEIVSRIFNEYISGLSLKTIADKLTSESVVYKPGKSEWNKNMISRIIENPHYVGDEQYPKILSAELFQSAMKRKNALGGKRAKDNDEINYLKSIIYCSSCGGKIRRLKNYSTKEKWLCNNYCKVSVYFDDNVLFNKIISVINYVITNPEILFIEDNNESKLDIESMRKTNEVQ